MLTIVMSNVSDIYLPHVLGRQAAISHAVPAFVYFCILSAGVENFVMEQLINR